MKIYLTLEELKRIQEDTYTCRDILKNNLSDKKYSDKVMNVIEEAIAEREKTLVYINDLIKKSDS